MSISPRLPAKEVDPLFETPLQSSLELLIEAIVPKGITKARFLKQVSEIDIPKTVEILDELGLTKTWEDRSTAIYRGRGVISAAYPNYPASTYTNEYIERALQVMPGLFNNSRVNYISPSRQESHMSRLHDWLDGRSIQEMQANEALCDGTILAWKNVGLPLSLRKAVSFFEITHAADRLYDVEEQIWTA